MTIVFFTADYYVRIGNYSVGDDLITRGITLCSSQHITYYLPRLKFLAAKMAIGQSKPYAEIDDLLTESSAFAKINHNEVVELRVNALRKQYEEKIKDNKKDTE